MKSLLVGLMLLGGLALPARAQSNDIYDPKKEVHGSSCTVRIVAAGLRTQVDTPQLEGSSYVEVQVRDASNDACCSTSPVFETAITTGLEGCRRISKTDPYHPWVLKRWWQNLKVYCSTLHANGTAVTVAVVQCK